MKSSAGKKGGWKNVGPRLVSISRWAESSGLGAWPVTVVLSGELRGPDDSRPVQSLTLESAVGASC